jgi:hypothetical protein
MTSAIEAYQAFDRPKRGWVKVKLEPAQTVQRAA